MKTSNITFTPDPKVQPTETPKSFSFIDPDYQNYDANTKAQIDLASEEMDQYVKTKLPTGHAIEASQDTVNGKVALILKHTGGGETNIIAVSEADRYKSELFKGKNPIQVFVDLIAEGLGNLKKARI